MDALDRFLTGFYCERLNKWKISGLWVSHVNDSLYNAKSIYSTMAFHFRIKQSIIQRVNKMIRSNTDLKKSTWQCPRSTSVWSLMCGSFWIIKVGKSNKIYICNPNFKYVMYIHSFDCCLIFYTQIPLYFLRSHYACNRIDNHVEQIASKTA